MELGHVRVALRERGLLDVLDLSICFCVANAIPYLRLSLVTIAPAFGVSCVAARLGGWVAGWVVAIATAALVDAPFVVLASRLVFSDGERIRNVVHAAASATPRLVAARCAQGMAFGFSLLLAGLPWPWLGSAMLFVPEVVVLERSTLRAAWKRARLVAHAQLGVATAALLLLSLLVVGAAVVADVAGRELLGSVLEIRPPLSVFRAGGSVLALLGFFLARPFCATSRFFVYLDARTRNEGWDIQTRFSALAAREHAEVLASAVAQAPPRAGV